MRLSAGRRPISLLALKTHQRPPLARAGHPRAGVPWQRTGRVGAASARVISWSPR